MALKLLAMLICADACQAASIAADLPEDQEPHLLASEVVNKTIELVEAKGLYPRQQSEYAQAKGELLAALAGQAGDIDRKDLYARIGKLLRTLDVDGHSFIMPPVRQFEPQGRAVWPYPLHPTMFKLVTTDLGTVLRWVPPAIVGAGSARFANYLEPFYGEAVLRPELAEACALVVDLSEQTGGNAWPPLIAMYPLLGDANKANWVDRDGNRRPVVSRAELESMNRQYAGERTNPLARFANTPLAVLVGERTASAGEMLLVALLGEERVQTFGRTSFGMSTSNGTYPLADGSTLVLTVDRYALGDGPVYRGGIPPMHPGAAGESLDASLRAAAKWAAAHSPNCKAKKATVASTD